MFKVDVKKIGGDTAYAFSANRTIYKEMDIQTSFAKRDRPFTEKQEKDFVRQELSRVMATVNEGIFSTEKEH